jgi:hypothetical protein
MMRVRERHLAVVVGRGRGDGLALGDGLGSSLAAEFRVLAALKVGNGILGAAEAQLHGVSIVAGS